MKGSSFQGGDGNQNDAAPPELSEVALNLSALMEVAFGDRCFAFASMWMHSRSSNEDESQTQDYVTPQPVSVRTCSASGTKFFDLDADGEPFPVTDKNGHYVIHDIRPPSGTYRLREELASPGRRRTSTPWKCSFPNEDTSGGGVERAGPEGGQPGHLHVRERAQGAGGLSRRRWRRCRVPRRRPSRRTCPPDLDRRQPAGPVAQGSPRAT